jgi:hemerythrin-like domain-containing protein
MPIFTEHLRNEIGVIQVGLSQLDRARKSILAGRQPNLQDLRIITYALRLLFKRNHVTKLETLLYPELDSSIDAEGFEHFSESTERLYNGQAKLQLMRLQLALDAFGERSSRDELARCLEDCLLVIRMVLDKETNTLLPLAERQLTNEQQDELYMKAQELDRKQALERVQATQALMTMDLARASGA